MTENKEEREFWETPTIEAFELMGIDLAKVVKDQKVPLLQGLDLTWESLLKLVNSMVKKGPDFTKKNHLEELFDVMFKMVSGPNSFLAKVSGKTLKN